MQTRSGKGITLSAAVDLGAGHRHIDCVERLEHLMHLDDTRQYVDRNAGGWPPFQLSQGNLKPRQLCHNWYFLAQGNHGQQLVTQRHLEALVAAPIG